MTETAVQEPILCPFKALDVQLVQNRDGWEGMTLEMALAMERGGPAFTAVIEGRVLGMAGVVVQWPGVGTCWMLLSKDIEPYAMWMTRMVRKVLADTQRSLRLHRLESVVLVDSERNRRFTEALGFTVERDGVARAYTADRRDMVRYERVQVTNG